MKFMRKRNWLIRPITYIDSCTDLMRKEEIDKMVKAIKKVTKKACKNKKSARKFLIKSGIIKK